MPSTIGQQRAKVGDHPTVEAYNLPVAAATEIFQGTLVALALSGTNDGYLVPAAAASIDQRVLGVAAEDVDNSAGAAGAKSCRVLVGVFPFAMGGTTNALTNKHIGKPCYASDDVTVNRLPSTNRPYAGIVRGISGSQVLVEVGTTTEDPNIQDVLLLADADYSSAGQYTIMAIKSDGDAVQASAAGQQCIGVLQNAPATGAVAVVRTFGRSPCYASASINPGVALATTNAGTTKAAAATTCDASGASATALCTGSFVLGTAVTAGSSGQLHLIHINPQGAIPGAAA